MIQPLAARHANIWNFVVREGGPEAVKQIGDKFAHYRRCRNPHALVAHCCMSDFWPRIALLIPALNEEATLPAVLADLPLEMIEEVVVIDNGSSDRTAQVARASGATVLNEPRRGYGSACLAGLAYLQAKHPDIVVFLDADYSDHPDELPTVVRPIVTGECDFVIGSRTKGQPEPGALLLHARIGNALATFLIRLLYGFSYSDLGPFRAIRFSSLLELGMIDRTYGWTVEMQIKAVRHKLRVTEVPVRYRTRAGGESKVSGTIKGTVLAGVKILWTVFRYAWGPA